MPCNGRRVDNARTLPSLRTGPGRGDQGRRYSPSGDGRSAEVSCSDIGRTGKSDDGDAGGRLPGTRAEPSAVFRVVARLHLTPGICRFHPDTPRMERRGADYAAAMGATARQETGHLCEAAKRRRCSKGRQSRFRAGCCHSAAVTAVLPDARASDRKPPGCNAALRVAGMQGPVRPAGHRLKVATKALPAGTRARSRFAPSPVRPSHGPGSSALRS